MKKTLILALLAVLVLGIFTACNGDVNAALLGKRTITLELANYDSWKFNNESRSLVVSIPAGCKTWGDLVSLTEKVSITVTNGSTSVTLSLDYKDNDVFFYGSYYYGHIDRNAKVSYQNVQIDDSIDFGKTYDLYLGIPT